MSFCRWRGCVDPSVAFQLAHRHVRQLIVPRTRPRQLIATYGARGLAVLGTPCAQFANQEAAANGEIMNTLQYVRPGGGFVPAFPLSQKLLVNGVGAHPLWVYARAWCPAPGLEIADNLPLWLPITSRDVNWNFVSQVVGLEALADSRGALLSHGIVRAAKPPGAWAPCPASVAWRAAPPPPCRTHLPPSGARLRRRPCFSTARASP